MVLTPDRLFFGGFEEQKEQIDAEATLFFFLAVVAIGFPAERAAGPPINLGLSSAAVTTNYGTY